MTPRSVPVSVLIPAKNEASNIAGCIRSVAFAEQVVVVDSHSTDGTQALAEAEGAEVLPFAWNGEWPKKKNWALENVRWRHEWVLILDADERITPALAREIAEVVRTSRANGCYINRRFMFMGRWLRHCGYYPSWNLRLFRHAMGRYEKLADAGDTGSGDNEVHEHVVLRGGEAQGRVAYLRHDMLHYAYPSLAVWVEKHNRYSNWEAAVLNREAEGAARLDASLFGGPLQAKRWLKEKARRLPFRPTLRFLYHYVLRQGFRDGYPGLVMCRLLAWYEFMAIAKAHEMRLAAQAERRRSRATRHERVK
jgi:glycosyltransferase involved in cell wall biosynthesis